MSEPIDPSKVVVTFRGIELRGFAEASPVHMPPVPVTVTAQVTEDAYARLEQIRGMRQPVTIQTPQGTFENMVVADAQRTPSGNVKSSGTVTVVLADERYYQAIESLGAEERAKRTRRLFDSYLNLCRSMTLARRRVIRAQARARKQRRGWR